MPISGPAYRFEQRIIIGAPVAEGIYALWSREEMIYVGSAASGTTIKAQLLEHFAGRNPCTAHATHYTWELSLRPTAREAQVLNDFKEAFGRVPLCNEPPT